MTALAGGNYDRAMKERRFRHLRSRPDRQRRPTEGFRASSSARFDRLVEDALDSLPATFLDYLENVQITVEEVPSSEMATEGDGILLGLYEGIPRTERDFSDGLLPDRITLFRRPLEMRAQSKADLAEIVRETVVHEIAHHFGIDDDQLDDLGGG